MLQIQQQIEKILVHLNQFYPLINSHMVEYFSKNLYEGNTPISVKEEIEVVGVDVALNSIFDKSEKTPKLNEFIRNCRDFSLYNNKDICLNVKDLHKKFASLGFGGESGLKLDVYMQPKKSHEVEILSSIAASLKQIGRTSHIVDIGDGKGYLSSLLALHHKIPVLGVDSSEVNTGSAMKRAEKMGRNWYGIVKNKAEVKVCDRKFNPDAFLYKQITKYVTDETNFKQLVDDVFIANSTGLSLVGLHTCGDLAPSSIKIFTNNNDVKTICNVSCCYHLVTEAHEVEGIKKSQIGFPMSNFLQNKNFKLGRPARMLTAQSTDRILVNKVYPNKRVVYRAVFDLILDKHFPNLEVRTVRKFKREPKNFVDYTREAVRRLEINLELTDEEIQNFYDLYKCREKELYLFNLLKSMMAPAIESLILLDRLLYLRENNVSNSFLVQLFDPVISPRCYGLIAFKDV